MKNFLYLVILLSAFSFSAFAQEKIEKAKPTDTDKAANFDADGKIKRGAPISNAKKVSLARVLKEPNKYVGKNILVEGVIVRSCKIEGCWMELTPSKDAQSVRVKFKDHAFFIPLDSAGMNAKAEGVFSIKTLSKKEVDHLMNEDGAKFADINKDGTVTEISFEATGVELTKK
ncbi:hypothetical protein BH24ACI2_BH24ACI2_04310 [soil metagenome]|jgi:hypothetical protein|nr:DUF4920 domain-containing protein [Acidobacteriota bacterium]